MKINGSVTFNGSDFACEMWNDSEHENTSESPNSTRDNPICTAESPICTRDSPISTRISPICTRENPICTMEGPICTRHPVRSCRSSPCYITVENEGRLEQLQIHPPDECQFTIQSPAAYKAYINSGYNKEGDETDLAAYRNHVNHLAGINLSKENENEEIKRSNKRRRIVAKSGDTNVNLYKVTHRRKQFLKDIFTTMIEMQWRYTLLAFTSSFFLSWLFFAVIWYIIGLVHGDFLLEHASKPLANHSAWLESGPWTNGSSAHVPCLLATKDFTSAFLFSVETQHTIGYGSRQTTEECPEAVIFQCIQSIVGVVIQACMVGIVFAKLSRPKTRSNTVLFSRNACVTQRNGDLYLQFRVGNMRASKLLESQVKAVFVHHNMSTDEGENIHFHQEILKVGSQLDGEEENVFLFWPIIISHKIDSDSPFYHMGQQDVIKNHFEIVVILDGIVEPTGNNMQARSSYLPNEIMWGHRFENMVTYAMKQGVYAVDCSQLNALVADTTPLSSAAELDKNKKLAQQRKEITPKSSLVSNPKTHFNRFLLDNSPTKKRHNSLIETGRFRTHLSLKKEDSESEEGDSGASAVTCSTNGTNGNVTPMHSRANGKKLSFQSDLSPASCATTASSASALSWTSPGRSRNSVILVNEKAD